MTNYTRGSKWRKWDLHIHTKETGKNDQFKSKTFDDFCVTLFRKALENGIAAIGITDYFNIDNYTKIKEFINKIDSCTDSTDEEKKNKKKEKNKEKFTGIDDSFIWKLNEKIRKELDEVEKERIKKE